MVSSLNFACMFHFSSKDSYCLGGYRYPWFQIFAVFWMLHAFFWVTPRRLNFICRRFGTLCLFHLHRRIGVEWLCLRNVGVFIGEKSLGSKMASASLLDVMKSTGSGHFWAKPLFPMNTPTFLKHSHSTLIQLWRWNRQSVPKRQHIKFRRLGITQKKAHNMTCLTLNLLAPTTVGARINP